MAPNSRKKKAHGNTLTCFCDGHCPDNLVNGTCETRIGGSCFSSVEEVLEEDSGQLVEERTYGCMPPEQSGGLLQCKVGIVPHLHGKNIFCCDDKNFCNKNLHPKFTPRTTTPAPQQPLDESTVQFLALMISVIVCGLIFLIVIFALYVIYKRREQNGTGGNTSTGGNRSLMVNGVRQKCPRVCLIEAGIGGVGGGGGGAGGASRLADLEELSSGSGSGLPLLVQRTIAKEIEYIRLIGQGRFSKVYLALFRGEYVAAKVFHPSAESSWFHESEIYQSVNLRNENIMGFVAADIDGNGQRTMIQHYHEHGCLSDYLKTHVLSPMKLYDMAQSIAAGLAYLHTEISGSQGKDPLAHGDLNSKNIMIRKDLRCAVGDFSLTIKYVRELDQIKLPQQKRQLTSYRYVPPEILNNTMDKEKFESYKMVDMYALGLVYWEMARRCSMTTSTGQKKSTLCDDYALPYHDVVPVEPTRLEDMRKVVCGDGIREGIRPPVPLRWDDDEILRCLKGIMTDCWKENPASRLTSLRVKKTLGKLRDNSDQFVKIDAIRLV